MLRRIYNCAFFVMPLSVKGIEAASFFRHEKKEIADGPTLPEGIGRDSKKKIVLLIAFRATSTALCQAEDVALTIILSYNIRQHVLSLIIPVKRTIPHNSGTLFVTFTCHQWLPLIEKTNGYDIIYKWFDHLKSYGHHTNGYVIMPNHVHVMISFINAKQSINRIIGNGKRFMAYEIIKRLETNNELDLFQNLSNKVEVSRKNNNKLHEVGSYLSIGKIAGATTLFIRNQITCTIPPRM